ncbi:glycosyltransferase family 4 protein [Paenibacillus sp. FSL R5-0887]|uniref:glycosyltransferase family 4 protein n=1 Tax=Paenibacillus sp. FSL R5-0887 TaxID=2921662 RepID=UPI0030F7C45A
MADKATIVLFSHVSNTRSITGAEKLLLFFAQELSPYFNCILVAPQDGKLTSQARSCGISVQLLSIPLLYGMYTPYAGLEADAQKFQESREYHELTDWLNSLRPAFVITSTCVHALPAMAAKSLGIPVIWKISETITDNEYTPISVGLILRNSDEILAISQTAAACFPEDVRAEKVIQLPPSWNDKEMMIEAWSKLRSERRRELRVKPHEQLIGYISSFINKEKGLEHFVKMAVLVHAVHPSSKFVVIGSAGDKSYYERCVRKVKLEGLYTRFKFVGYAECLPSAYCAMDVLVVPSLIREGFGMTALEGMAFGKPVIAYDSGGLREILHAAGCGENLVPASDISALAERVNVMLAQPGLALTLGSQARERVDAVYGPAAYRSRLQGLAEMWNLRYCSAPAVHEADSVVVVEPPAVQPDLPAASPALPPRSKGLPSRVARKRRGKARARRRSGRPLVLRRVARKRRKGSARRRSTAGGKRRRARRGGRRRAA